MYESIIGVFYRGNNPILHALMMVFAFISLASLVYVGIPAIYKLIKAEIKGEKAYKKYTDKKRKRDKLSLLIFFSGILLFIFTGIADSIAN